MALIKVKTRGTENVVGAGKNLIINGAMTLAQRGTSSTADGYGSLDRWKMTYGGGGTLTHSQQSLSSSDTPYTLGLRNYMRSTVTTASSAAGLYAQLEHRIEAATMAQSGWNYTSSSSELTLSFWAKSSLAGTYYIQLRTIDTTEYYYSKSFTLAANTWKKITCTVAGNSNLVINNDTGHGFTVLVAPDYGTTYTGHSQAVTGAWYNRTLNAGYFPNYAQDWFGTAGNTFEITGVQLEVGGNASDFEHRSFDTEMEKCERYFQTYSNTLWQGTNEHAANYSLYLDGYFRKRMRATPTATLIGTVAIGRPQVAVSQRPNSISGLSEEGFFKCNWPSSGTYGGSLGTHGDAYYRMVVGAYPTNRIDFSAEL